METITITAMVDEHRHLELDMPADLPIGPVELTIRPLPAHPSSAAASPKEAIRAALAAASLLSTSQFAPPDASRLSIEERLRLGRLFSDARCLAAQIDEDRGTY
jgi:hypothetical protein